MAIHSSSQTGEYMDAIRVEQISCLGYIYTKEYYMMVRIHDRPTIILNKVGKVYNTILNETV